MRSRLIVNTNNYDKVLFLCGFWCQETLVPNHFPQASTKFCYIYFLKPLISRLTFDWPLKSSGAMCIGVPTTLPHIIACGLLNPRSVIFPLSLSSSKTFFSLISLWTKSRLCRNRRPSTTSTATCKRWASGNPCLIAVCRSLFILSIISKTALAVPLLYELSITQPRICTILWWKVTRNYSKIQLSFFCIILNASFFDRKIGI